METKIEECAYRKLKEFQRASAGGKNARFGMRLKVCRSSAKAKADYVERENKYKNGVKAEDLVYCEEHNLPSWAFSAHDFFQEMDKQERTTKEKEGTETDPDKKKVKCRELVFTLPSKLEREDQIQLTKEYCQKVFGEDHVYTFAIHENRGSLSGEKIPMSMSFFLIEK